MDGEKFVQVRRIASALGLSWVCLSCLGCQVKSEKRIAGTYQAECPCATIILTVDRDHSFVQNVKMKSGETKQLAGNWQIDKKYNAITFAPFLDFTDDFRGKQEESSVFFGGPEWMPRGIMLGPISVKCPESSYEIDYVK
jgi:hypothetical protein